MTDIVEIHAPPEAVVDLTASVAVLELPPTAIVEIREATSTVVEVPAQAQVLFDITPEPGSVAITGGTGYQHSQGLPATVWAITHDLGFDPAGIVVESDDGYVLDGFGVQYLTPGQTLRLSFDIAVAGTAYLS